MRLLANAWRQLKLDVNPPHVLNRKCRGWKVALKTRKHGENKVFLKIKIFTFGLPLNRYGPR